MTTPKPAEWKGELAGLFRTPAETLAASAPQADSLPAIVAEMREAQIAYAGSHPSGTFRRLADRIEALSGLGRIDGMEFYLHENPDSTGNEEPVRLVMAMSVGDKVFCHRITQGDNGVCKPAAEPAPVAQGDGPLIVAWMEGEAIWQTHRGPTQGTHALMLVDDHDRIIADHARREAALLERVAAAEQMLELTENKAHDIITGLEASLAACRAFAQDVMECWPDGAPDGGELQELAEKHGMLREVIMPGPCGENCGCSEFLTAEDFPARCYRKTTALTGDPASDAAIDALRKEAPHAE